MEGYALSGGREGYERLRVLAAARRASTLELFGLAGLRPGMRCADLGCGSGDVTFEIGDVNQWHGAGQYDFVYSRFLFQHLARPVDLLHRMWEAVRPGGALAVEDADLEGLFCDPDNDGFSFYRRIYAEVLVRNGGDPGCARRLARYFREIGISDPAMRMLQGISADGDAKVMPLLTLEAITDSIVSAGLADADQVASAIEDLAAFTADPRTTIADPRIFQVWARRGAGDAAVPQRPA